jgi:hypothetical protein
MHKKETNKIVDIKDTNEQKTDSMILQLPSDTNSIKPRIKRKYTLSDIQGAWGESPGENAYFLIEGDSALYIEGEIIPIAVSNDSLIFYYPDSPMSFKINWIRNDSMSLMMYDELNTLVRLSK